MAGEHSNGEALWRCIKSGAVQRVSARANIHGVVGRVGAVEVKVCHLHQLDGHLLPVIYPYCIRLNNIFNILLYLFVWKNTRGN